MKTESKPIFLIGFPIEESISESDYRDFQIFLYKTKKKHQEEMPDYHVVVFSCSKLLQTTFTILTADGKQSNV